jgi:hypothetical protein
MNSIRMRMAFASLLWRRSRPVYWPRLKLVRVTGFPFRVCAAENPRLSLASPADSPALFTVVADGVQSPRGLAFGPGGRLDVAQAGAGGATLTSKITG